MTSEEMLKVTEEAIQEADYGRYGLKGGFLKLRFPPERITSNTWKIALWIGANVGREIELEVITSSNAKTVKEQIIQKIEAQLTEWRKFVT